MLIWKGKLTETFRIFDLIQKKVVQSLELKDSESGEPDKALICYERTSKLAKVKVKDFEA